MSDITQTSITDMETRVDNFEVTPVSPDSEDDSNETVYDNTNFERWFGYFKSIPEYKVSIQSFANWVLGKGLDKAKMDDLTVAVLDTIDGWGEDTIMSVLWNMICIKKVEGDAFAEVIRDPKTGTLLNLKPLGTLRIVANKQGRIKKYVEVSKVKGKKNREFKPTEILHLVNDRVANEIHGTSITQSVEWVIDARNEAMQDLRRTLHRSTVRIMAVDETDKNRHAQIKKDYADAINKGEVMLVDKNTEEIRDHVAPQSQHLEWIRYLENFFYQALGVPKVILGGSEEFTEASSKIAYLTFEQVYSREVEELKADLWNQLAIKIEINKPASLTSEMLSGEEKNKAQTGFQPNDVEAGVGK